MHTRTYRTTALAAAALATCGWLAGCSDDPVGGVAAAPTTGNSLQQIDLNQPYGGLAYTDEPAAFGDASLQADAQAELSPLADVDDDEQSLAARFGDVRGLLALPDVHRTYVRIVWGMLEGERSSIETAAAPLDWTGGLTVSGGALVVKRTILFERLLQGDHLLPREDRQHVEWVSHTGPYIDGIVVCVLSRPDSLGAIHGTLTFRTPQLARSFDLAQLEGRDETVPTDDLGNGVHLSALARGTVDCPSGFMAGRWFAAAGGSGGFFRGLWLTESGRLRGFLMGRYGVNDAGEHVFAGKLIALDGRIRGLCAGTYAPQGDGTGAYEGHWANRDGTRLGVMAGQYRTRPAPDPARPGVGFFQGRWQEHCDQPAAL